MVFFVVLAAKELCSKAANELLTTERTYLSSLSTLIKVYVGPLQEQVTPRQPQRLENKPLRRLALTLSCGAV